MDRALGTWQTDWHNLSAKLPKLSSLSMLGTLGSFTSHPGVVGRDTSGCSPRCIVVEKLLSSLVKLATRGVQPRAAVQRVCLRHSFLGSHRAFCLG